MVSSAEEVHVCCFSEFEGCKYGGLRHRSGVGHA